MKGLFPSLQAIDAHLLDTVSLAWFDRLPRGLTEFLYFGIKEARACLFAGVIFLSMFIVPREGLLGLPRYDVLLLIALATQCWMLWAKLETWDEVKAITIFHIVGFAMEVFKTSASISSWTYQDDAYTKLFGVPLFSGFMYAAVGSYIIQAWRMLRIRIERHPPYWMAIVIAILIYANFFTHHFIPDLRWYLAAATCIIYARTTVVFHPIDRERRMPLIIGFVLTGFFIWLAENISTFYNIWTYPNQLEEWSMVHIGKWSSWALLVIMTFTIVANLRHIRATIHITTIGRQQQ
jgi:uncharacterized membrane protein YoaT (DUF817 family)